MDIFAYAARKAIRFPSDKGLLTVEDLWNLPLTSEKNASLDKTAKTVHQALKAHEEESFVEPRANTGILHDQVRMDVVKHIIGWKLNERDVRKKATENREQKRRILEIIATKQDEALSNKSIDELTKMVEEL